MQPRDLLMADYKYDLPDSRIARYPLAERDQSKLLIWKAGNIAEDIYVNIDRYLPENALLVFNNTRVIPARIRMYKQEGGGMVELFCLEPSAELSTAMAEKQHSRWKCLVGGAKKWKGGAVIADAGTCRIAAHKATDPNLPPLERGAQWIDFEWAPPDLTFSEIIGQAGQVPLPPYLQRAAEAADRERYQTIYARTEGSVAAPTAGLHFTERLFGRLRERGAECLYVTLHVGAGTFKPVQSETIADHEMHAEYFDVSLAFLEKMAAASASRPVVCVGTTSLRTIESLFLMGCKLLRNPFLSQEELTVQQWDAWNLPCADHSVQQAFSALSDWAHRQGVQRIINKTQLLIAPGYRLRTAQALITNFHQPGSTLLLLVAAITGHGWRDIYDYALARNFRFLSYGDGSLLFVNEPV